MDIRRSSNPAFCSNHFNSDCRPGYSGIYLDGSSRPLRTENLQTFWVTCSIVCPHRENFSSYLQMESLLIQLMMLSLTFLPHTARKAVAPSSWWPPCSYWHVAVRSSESHLFSKLNKPRFLSPCHREMLHPASHSMITDHTAQHARSHCWLKFTLLSVFARELHPSQSIPSLNHYSGFFLPRCRTLPLSLLNLMNMFLQPV